MSWKYKSSTPNVTRKRLNAVKSLRLRKDVKILQADKDHCRVVSDESKYERNLKNLLGLLLKELQLKLRGKYRKFLPNIKLFFLLI
jgi:hypothetical protein